MSSALLPVMLSLASALSPIAALDGTAPDDAARPLRSSAVQIDQCFIEEQGDAPRFVMLGSDLALALETGGMSWTVTRDDGCLELVQSVVQVQPVGAREGVAPVGEERLPGVISRFRGPPEDWKRAQPTWRRVRYTELWDGIDLRLEAEGRTVKATWRLAPGADPAELRLRHRGADALRVDAEGRLVIETAAGAIVDAAPVAWQEHDGERRDVPVAFALERRDDGAVDVGFTLGAHDPTRPLLIDPAVLVQAGFIGGTARDEASDVAVDAAGNVYVCGWARSTEASFPVVVGPSLVHHGAPSPWGDAFVAKLDPTGNTLLYCGFIGGWEYEFANGIAVDAAGRAYLTGHTRSDENELFPVVGGPYVSMKGSVDAWVARVSADGSALEYCGYIGGTGFEDRGLDIDVDGLGRAYVVGHTDSEALSFPVKVGPGLTKHTYIDAWIARLAPDGKSLEYCGYIGGDDADQGYGVAVDGTGGAWVTGKTYSDEASFPVTVGPDLTYNGGGDGFLTRVASDGSGLVWCGYIGGDQYDYGGSVTADATGAVYVIGSASSDETTFPVSVGPDLTFNGGTDAFVAKFAADGSGPVWSGYLGGSSGDYGVGLDLDVTGDLWVSGATYSTEATFPVSGDLDDTHNGSGDGFVARVRSDGSGLGFAGYVGGSGNDSLGRIALVPAGLLPTGVFRAWSAGVSKSTETTYPVQTGPDVTANGAEDAVVVSVVLAPDPWTDLGFSLGGTYGAPQLTGAGPLVADTPVTLRLTNALENSVAFFVIGIARIDIPFFGGTLVPDPFPPNGLFVTLATDPNGEIVIAGTWPPGVPSAFTTTFQYWIQDPGSPFGMAASNALAGTTP